ncbi:YrhK family protein [Agrococcus sp. Ld7]|uniref:YrhK family protein n=1 Tax=Agrococcus sp. Ld7 TaxID=649148 RepID=UPI003870C9F0
MSAANQQRSPDDELGPDDIAVRIGREELVIRNRYEALSIANDVLIGILFLVGSILFLWESTTDLATWLFIIGSAEFLLRPVIRLARRTHLKRFGPGRDRTDHRGDY